MATKYEEKVKLTMVGKRTGEPYPGEFTFKKLLVPADELARDARRRELLGTNPDFASARALGHAQVFSELFVRVVEGPAWWSATGGGLGLPDDNVAQEVYAEALKVEQAFSRELDDRAAKAQEQLKASAPKA